jgi:hypothetical protein
VTIYWSHRMTFEVWWLMFICFIYKTLVPTSQRKQFVDKMQSFLILQYVAFILITGLWKVKVHYSRMLYVVRWTNCLNQ